MPPIEQSVTEIREAGTQLRSMTSAVRTAEEQPNVSERHERTNVDITDRRADRQVEPVFTRHELRMMLLLSIQDGLFTPAEEGDEGSGAARDGNARQRWADLGRPADIGPMNQERSAILLEGCRMLLRRANNWRENVEIVRSTSMYLATLMEVSINAVCRDRGEDQP